MIDPYALDRIARSQHGLATTTQLFALGATEDWIRTQLRYGRLHPARRGVFRVSGVPLTQDQAWLAAVLEAGPHVVLSHGTAAAAWDLRGFDPPDSIDLLSPSWRPRIPGARGHSTRWLPDADRTTLRRLPITSAERTMIDASGSLHPWTLGRVVDDALRRKVLHLPHLVRCFEGLPPSGRRPSRAMREVLAERVPGFDPGGSAAELGVLAVLKAAGIHPLPVQQYRIEAEGHRYRLDFAWPETKHAIEFDGGGGHNTESARHADRDRWRRIQRAGWTLWAVTERTRRSELVAIGITATADDAAA